MWFPSSPLKLRVTEDSRVSEYSRMKNTFSVAQNGTDFLGEQEFAYFGIFDGHDGPEAAQYAKEHLLNAIIFRKKFWSYDDTDIMNTIRKGYVQTHYDMWKIHETWPRRADQFYSTSGTTASLVFIRNRKFFISHVGDSRVVLGYQIPGDKKWRARTLTTNHKLLDTPSERSSILERGGKVSTSSGTPRVVWIRPSLKHRGPDPKSSPVEEIPLSPLSRSLGDLWSYNCETKKYVISPEPDVSVHPFNVESFRCLIIATNDLWDIMDPIEAVRLVEHAEKCNAKNVRFHRSPNFNRVLLERDEININPSTYLVEDVEQVWLARGFKGKHVNVVTVS